MSQQSTVQQQATLQLPLTGTVPAKLPRPGQLPGKARSRGRGRIGVLRPVRIGQVALWEIALVAVAATVWPWRIVSIVVAAVAAVTIIVTSVRLAGLCCYQWIGVLFRYRARRRSAQVKSTDPLAAVVPGVTLRRQIDRAGNRAGLADLGDSLSAVVRLTPTASPNPALPLGVLVNSFDRTDIRLAGAQLVVWSMPSPPRARYYGDQRDLEPMQVYWLALRYRPADAPVAALARGGGDLGAARATATAGLALVARLAEAGYAGVVVDEPELRQELLVALGSDHSTLGGAAFTVKETWRDWSIGTLRQFCFAPRTERDAVTMLGKWTAQAAFTCTSYSLHRTARGEVRGEGRVRIGVHPTSPVPTAAALGRALGVELLARNGRQGSSVADTLPLALP
ncbi:MAG TPA: type VII secretion protein EccE [Pseudonocardiaceae bacterium]